jgi:protein TonB
LGQQGTVLLEVLVSAAGRVAELEIVESSGVKSLDAAALKAVREWRFAPGRENGRAKAMRVRVPVRFELQ